MSDEHVSEKRIFSYQEAVALLPEVRQITDEAYGKVEALSANVDGAALPGPLRVKLDAIVSAWAHSLIEKGLEVKGLWLVDFDNGSGYYCWQYPETALQYYHSYDDGFRGRMRIQ